MKIKLITVISGLGILLLILLACVNPINEKDDESLVQWMQVNSAEIETIELISDNSDLKLLDQIIGDAEVVCIGESRHDIKEQFMLKHRFIKYLVEEMGFTTFVLEESLPHAYRINNYILNGDGNIDEIMAEMPGWFLWDVEEMSAIIQWMHDYNTDPSNKNKLKFYGMDIVAPNDALEQVFDYLDEVDPEAYQSWRNKDFARDIIDDSFWPNTWQQYAEMSIEKKQTLKKNYESLYAMIENHKSEGISKTSESEYDWIIRMAYCALQANEMFSAESRMDMGLIREESMAGNILWIKDNFFPEDKMIVWAHNVHICTDEFTMSGEAGSIKGMGYLMKKHLGDNMVAIGGVFDHGHYAERDRTFLAANSSSVDGALAQMGYPLCLLNLKGDSENELVNEWLNSSNIMRGQDFEVTCIPGKSFDAIYFTESISRVTTNASSGERLRNMN